MKASILVSLLLGASIASAAHADLVLHLDFENNTSNAGTLGAGHNGTISGDASYDTDSMRGEYSMNMGADGKVSVPAFALGNTSTVAAWINVGPGEDSIQPIAATRPAGKVEGMMFFVNHWATSDRNLELETSDGPGDPYYYTAQTAAGVVGDGWHHVALTMNRNTDEVEFFVDGSEVSQIMSGFDEGFTDNLPMSIGMQGTNFYHFDGRIDDFRVYNTVLGQPEIASLAGVPEPTSLAALIGMALAGMIGYRWRKRWGA